MDTTSLVISVIASAIGAGYFVYGKRQAKIIPLLCGIGLCVFPYFVSSNTVAGFICLALIGMPFIFAHLDR